jgi:hypothetical protein
VSSIVAGRLALHGELADGWIELEGERKRVSTRLARRDRRKLRRRGQISASAISVETGQFGDKTTVETLKLIAQG